MSSSSGRQPSGAVHTTRKGGWRYNTYIMYHGTDASNVDAILSHGFRVDRANPRGLLGAGIYASRDVDKTRNYGNVALKLLVKAGKVGF